MGVVVAVAAVAMLRSNKRRGVRRRAHLRGALVELACVIVIIV